MTGAGTPEQRLRIDLVGPFPPPYGGVSVHLERLVHRLHEEGDEATVICPRRRNEIHHVVAYRRILAESRGQLIHAHVGGFQDNLCLGVAAALGRRVALTVHGQSLEDDYRSHGWIERRSLVAAVRRFHAVIAVNEHIRKFAIGEIGLPPDRVFQIPAFLPPDYEAARVSPGDDVEAFLRRWQPVVSANAFDLTLYQGTPLYGADLLVEMLRASAATHPSLGVVLYVSTLTVGDQARLDALRVRAAELGVAERLLLVTGSRAFNPMLVRGAAMLRPTVTDGDAVSIRDALWLGVPAIASDAVPRPTGTRLFRSRDSADLWRATREVLDDVDAARAGLAELPRYDPFFDLRAVYDAIAQR